MNATVDIRCECGAELHVRGDAFFVPLVVNRFSNQHREHGGFSSLIPGSAAMTHPLNEAFYEAARRQWPALTPRQFGDAARAVVARLPGSASIAEISQRIEAELRACYGEGEQAMGAWSGSAEDLAVIKSEWLQRYGAFWQEALTNGYAERHGNGGAFLAWAGSWTYSPLCVRFIDEFEDEAEKALFWEWLAQQEA